MGKQLFKWSIFFLVYVLSIPWDADAGPERTKQTNPQIVIPSPAFEVERTRSDPSRPVRAGNKKYSDPLFDSHTHLYPPNEKNAAAASINKRELKQVIQALKKSGVKHVIFMPTPNDGIRPNQELGVVKRKMIRDLDRDRIKIFCGSNYITCWLNDAYRNGCSERKVKDRLAQLSKDIDSGLYDGVGEIGTYHFDKGYDKQRVLEYPPNFEPFLRVVDLIAKKGAWLDLHAEPVDPKGKSHETEVFGGLELLYTRCPDLKLIYSHTAMTNVTNARRILKKYPRVMMNIKIETRHSRWKNLEPVVNTEGNVYEDWAELFEEMPERFMIGTDFHFGRKGVILKKYGKRIRQMRQLLGTLNPEAARLIAFENARKIFK